MLHLPGKFCQGDLLIYGQIMMYYYKLYELEILIFVTMLHPVRLSNSKGILKIGLLEKYWKNLGQGTNSLKHSRKPGFISIKNYIKMLNTTHKS